MLYNDIQELSYLVSSIAILIVFPTNEPKFLRETADLRLWESDTTNSTRK